MRSSPAMDLTLRSCSKDELGAFRNATGAAFGHVVPPEDIERLGRLLEPDRTLVAEDEGTFVGTTAAFTFTLTIPGGEVPAAGVTLVGVLPSHRRRGILTRLMQRQLEDIRDRDEPVAILWASEGGIYGRYGYGVSTIQGRISIERDRANFRFPSPPVGRTYLVPMEEAPKVLPPVYERVRRATPGMFARSAEWWLNHLLRDDEDDRREGAPLWCVVWEHEGRAEAYALYRIHAGWGEGVPSSRLEVHEALGTSGLADREIWRYIFGVDLIREIESFWLPADHPLLLTVAEPRRLRFTLADALWLRVVDLPAALEARSYRGDGAVVLEVSDPLFTDNSGVWKLTVEAGRATVRQTSDAPDLRMGIEELGSIYLGGVALTRHVRAGRIEEPTPGAASRADDLFRTETAPWCPEIF